MKRTALWSLVFLAGILVLLLVLPSASISEASAAASSTHPFSPVILGISFDWSTHSQGAPGSDNWPITWGDDGHQYTSWGDGGGFGGTNKNGRVSLGFGRVEGSKSNYNGHNVWGGASPESPSHFGGKSYGILSLGSNLYMWRCGAASNATAYDFQELYKSTDYGQSWVFTGVRFDPSSFPGSDDGFFCPTFLQFGKGYQGARDGYVYIYAPEIKTDVWAVHKPGEISLLRVPKNGLSDVNQYEFFAGIAAGGVPLWTTDASQRQPVFEDPDNGVMQTSASYNTGLDRYFLITEHTESLRGNIGIYDAPEPWGPWTTVLFENGFGSPNIKANTFFWNFSNKWLSANGLDFVLVFTGKKSNDAWNSVEGSFLLEGQPGETPVQTPTPGAEECTRRCPDEPAPFKDRGKRGRNN